MTAMPRLATIASQIHAMIARDFRSALKEQHDWAMQTGTTGCDLTPLDSAVSSTSCASDPCSSRTWRSRAGVRQRGGDQLKFGDVGVGAGFRTRFASFCGNADGP